MSTRTTVHTPALATTPGAQSFLLSRSRRHQPSALTLSHVPIHSAHTLISQNSFLSCYSRMRMDFIFALPLSPSLRSFEAACVRCHVLCKLMCAPIQTRTVVLDRAPWSSLSVCSKMQLRNAGDKVSCSRYVVPSVHSCV